MKVFLALTLIGLVICLPAYGADPLKAKACTGLTLSTSRATNIYGYRIMFRDTRIAPNQYGELWSDSGVAKYYGTFAEYTMALQFDENDSTLNIQSGDTVSITAQFTSGSDVETTRAISLPVVTVDGTILYLGTDNCTYDDVLLTEKAGSTPSPTLTPAATSTPTPSTTPTVTPTLTPAATPTPSPASADIWYQAGVSIYPATGGSDVALSGDLSVQSDITATNLTASMPVVTDASKVLQSGAGYWTTFTTDAGSTVANSATDELGIVGGGIAATSATGDVVTVTATEAQTLSAVCTLGASYAGTVTVETSIVELPTSVGTTTAYTVDYTSDASTLTAGLTASFIAHTTNTGAATLAIDSLAAKDIFNSNDALAAGTGDVIENAVITVIYDGTQYQIISGNNSN